MTIGGHDRDRQHLAISRKSACRNMIKIIANGLGLSFIDEGFSCPITKRWNWF